MGSNYPITLWNPALYSTRQTTLDSSAESLDQPATTQPEPQTMTQSRKRENEAMDSTGLPTESINSKKPRKSRWDQQM